jgi:hypothetical protein
MYKRHTENPNLITIPACQYHGSYRLIGNYAMIDQYLRRTEQVMHQAVNHHRRVTMIRFDLRFPSSWDLEIYPYQLCISQFFRNLNYFLGRDSTGKGRSNKLRYVWSKEFGEENGRAHYHVAIMVNGDLYRPFGYYQPGMQSLARMIGMSWAHALGLWEIEAFGLVYFPNRSAMSFSGGDYQSRSEVFQRISYLSKVRTKHYGDGNRSFGFSLS